MESCRIVNIRDAADRREEAARWFHEKWGVPEDEYLGSMDECIHGGKAVPQWYLVLTGGEIAGGAGVIENDFHERRDLAPNVCALYVEPAFRGRGLARALLEHICRGMAALGVTELYLITGHTALYERLGWEFVTMVDCTDGSAPARLYRRETRTAQPPGEYPAS